MTTPTLTEYLVNKLTKVVRDINKLKDELVQYATNLDFEKIQYCTKRISEAREDHRVLSKDAIQYLAIEDIASNKSLFDLHAITYDLENGYSRRLSIPEAQILKAAGFDIKIKV